MNRSGLTLKPIWPKRAFIIPGSRSLYKKFGLLKTSFDTLRRYLFWKPIEQRFSKILLVFTLLSSAMGFQPADQFHAESQIHANHLPVYYGDAKCVSSTIPSSTYNRADKTFQKQNIHETNGGIGHIANKNKIFLINKQNENKVTKKLDHRLEIGLKKIKYLNGFKKVDKVVRKWKCQLQNIANKLNATKIDSNALSESELRTDKVHSSYQKSFPFRDSSYGTNLLSNPLKKLRSGYKKNEKCLESLLGLRTERNISKCKKQSFFTKSTVQQNSTNVIDKNSVNFFSNENSLRGSNKKAKLKISSTSKSPQKRENSVIVKRSAPSLNDDLLVDSHKRRRRKRKIDLQEVEVIKGAMAALPCDLTMQQSQDSVQLVLWIKEGMDTPLYSYDYRELQGGRPKETKPNSKSTLAKRTSFRTDGNPAALLVERAEREDAGVYRCRVDFLLTPTRNSRVNLSVIVPPSRAKVSWKHSTSNLILSNAQAQTDSGVIGPFREGEIPTLICSNDDGTPLPNIKWYDGDQLVDESYSVSPEKKIVTNTLKLSPLIRSDLGKRYTCQASNYNKTQPATSTITIGMILKIMSVKVEIPGTLQANIQSDIQCQVRGSIPVPNVSWWLGSKKLQVEKPQVQEEGNLTISTLHFTPKPEDDGALLICQAINTKIVDDVIQDTKLISVTYIPKVSVRLGRSLNPARIKEGDDVYFECSVIGKPPVFNIQWKHNDDALEAGSGIFVSNMSLVVQGVSRDNGGDYTCHATNAVGTGVSPPLHLDVKYAPVCATKQRVQHSVAKLENAEILCKVHANPSNVTFRWTFNNTAEAIDVPDGRFVISGTESRVNYTPMNELDYGTLLCWANNSIGVQDHPCVFQIVAAGKPDPPHNCRVFDVTISSLQVTCLAGDDGGLTQKFMMQVFKIGSSSPEKDMTKVEPSFSVANLRPATAYKILVVSLNEKGASRPTELKAYTVRMPETQEETSAAEPTRDRERDTTVIPFGVIIGSSVAAVPIVLITVFVIWCRTCRKNNLRRHRQNEFVSAEDVNEGMSYSRRRQGGGPNSESAQSISRKDSSLARSSLELPLSTDSSNADDCNPDVISHTSDPLENQKLMGNISTISNEPTGYFIGNGDANFIPLKCGVPISAHCMEYLQIMGNNSNSHNQENLQSCSLIHSSTDLPLNPSTIQIQYSAANSISKLKSKPQRSSHTSEQGLPIPDFYAQGYSTTKDKICTDTDKRSDTDTIQDICFAQTLPHLYNKPCGQYNTAVTYKHEHLKENKSISCMRNSQDEKRMTERLQCPNHISNVHNIIPPPESHYQHHERSHILGEHIPVSSQSIHQYGTLRRAFNGNNKQTLNTGKPKSSYNETNRGSMPDVRGPATSKNVQGSSHRKPKRESDV